MNTKAAPEDTNGARGQKRSLSETAIINGVEHGTLKEAERPVKRKRTTDGNEAKGAYKQYYNRRSGDSTTGEDDRLPLLKTVVEKFSSPNVLDIGCNDGSITIAVAKLGLCQVVGIDTDMKLVKRARNAVRDVVLSTQRKPTVAGVNSGNKNACTDADNVFPFNAMFRCEDVCKAGARTAAEKGKYDIVLCLSVTKWIHIAHGDDGIKRFFALVKDCLKEKGCMVLEPQPSKSYKNARRRGQAPKDMTLKAFKLRPEMFKDYLLGEGGFQRMEVLRDVRGKGQAFNRPVMAFYKDPTPASSEEVAKDSAATYEQKPQAPNSNKSAPQEGHPVSPSEAKDREKVDSADGG